MSVVIETQPDPIKPPELIDMFLAGVDAKRAAALTKQIEKYPEIDAEFWWSLINHPVSSP